MKITNFRGFRSLASIQSASWLILATAIVFALTILAASRMAQAQTFSVIHNFTGTGGDGANPLAGITLQGGGLFGTTEQGGVGGIGGPGTVYQMTHKGASWDYTPIFLFPGDGSGGANPSARVVFGPDGHLYGTTMLGGTSQAGVVFNLTPPLSICKTVYCSWKENVLWSFGSGNDGANPGYGDLIWDEWNYEGNIYGTTINGGFYGEGIVYELTKSGSSWSESASIVFNPDYEGPCPGTHPWGGVIYFDASFFGTTSNGTFQPIAWQSTFNRLQCILGFQESGDVGAYPYAGLTVDSALNLYGAASDGGANGGGTVFQLSQPYSQQFTLLYSFAGTPYQHCGPRANLTLDAAGNVYGTTACAGANHLGNVFKLTKIGDTWVYISLHDFTGNDGAFPMSNVTIDTDGTLYGTTSQGGSSGDGVVWMIKP